VARFTYIALDSRGQESTGLVEASTTNDAIGELRRAGYFPTHVYEEGAVATAQPKATRQKKPKEPRPERKAGGMNIVLFQRKTVKPKLLMIFTRQLATLIDAGLPLLRGLNVLAKQERDSVLKNTINRLADSVQGGSTFSEGLAQHPRIFNNLYVNMVKAGELGGVLEVVLNRLSEFMEKAQKIRGKVKAAMFYPCAVIFVATAIVDGLLRGDIRATERVELGSQARVIGNIETPALAIQPGAMFEGQCHFLPPPHKNDDEGIARSSVDNSTGSKRSPRRTRSKPNQQEETDAVALAAGR